MSPTVKKLSLLQRFTILRPGVGGTDKLKASSPLTVRVPVAYKLVKYNGFR